MPYQERHVETLPPLVYRAEEPHHPAQRPAEQRLLITVAIGSVLAILAAVAISIL